ncbi:MAG: class I SAM-dependent methyltransferase [Pseudomonadota bacterium]|nr:class I SAM-dependent methyltransferase [Pseudomonadota bacterium]
MAVKDHWEQVYSTRMAEKLGWYRPRLDLSLAWIDEIGLDVGDPIIDVGGGTSTLIDNLIDKGFESITVLDISENALKTSRKRLGRQSRDIMWLDADVTSHRLPKNQFMLWHDRAMFHFLTAEEDRLTYRANLLRTLRPGGHAIIGTFAPEAPPRCSGLPVKRYNPDHLRAELGNELVFIKEEKMLHITPGGIEQWYQFSLFSRPGPSL